MSFHKFGPNDIFYNRVKTHPQVNFIIYDQQIYYNNKSRDSGSWVNNAGMIPTGYISLYELNIDRQASQKIYPFINKDGSLYSFRTISTKTFNTDFLYGDKMTGSYPMSASISSDRYPQGGSRRRISALRTALNSYKILSTAYAYSSSLGDKRDQELRLISIPSIFYASSIQKGSVSCKFYISGTLISELRDDMKNGELRQVLLSTDGSTETASGSIAGVVLYNEGFLILTGSWPLSAHKEAYIVGNPVQKPRWIDFGGTGSASDNIPSSSFALNFSGTNYVPTVTMLAQAPLATVNYSNNPTSLQKSTFIEAPTGSFSGSNFYHEYNKNFIKNIVSGTWNDPEPSFKRTVFINYIGVYDDKRNLIAIAKMANPVRKRSQDDFTFKLKLDF